MYQQIKQLADEALALQNKDRMDAALREISALCKLKTDPNGAIDDSLAILRKFSTITATAEEQISAGDAVKEAQYDALVPSKLSNMKKSMKNMAGKGGKK